MSFVKTTGYVTKAFASVLLDSLAPTVGQSTLATKKIAIKDNAKKGFVFAILVSWGPTVLRRTYATALNA